MPIRLEIDVKLEERVYGYRLAFELPTLFRELRVAEESLTVDGERFYSRDRAQVILAKPSSGGEARFLVDWHLAALPIIQFPAEATFAEGFKEWLSHMLILAPIPSQISGDSSGHTLTPNREVTNLGEWITGLLALSSTSGAKIDQYLKIVMPDLKDFKNPVIGRDARTLTVQFQRDQASLAVPFRELSDGEKCFFVGAAVLASNEAYGPLFCFWDEPDNFLSTSELGDFVMDLRRAFQPAGQFVATSHNDQAIEQFSRGDTFLLGRASHLEPVRVIPASQISVDGDFLDSLRRNDIEV